MRKKQNKQDSRRFKWGGTHPFFLHPFLSFFTPPELRGKTVVDVGCGKGLNAYLIRVTRDTQYTKIIGLDINREYLDFCRRFRTYTKLVQSRLPKLPFEDKSVDFLICTEVIEHLDRKAGKVLLKEIDRVCRGRALITTPNVNFDTLPNKYEDAHHSKWSTDDFKMFDYEVHGLGLRTTILQSEPLIRIKQALYYIFTPAVFFIPQMGGMLLCVKDF